MLYNELIKVIPIIKLCKLLTAVVGLPSFAQTETNLASMGKVLVLDVIRMVTLTKEHFVSCRSGSQVAFFSF